MLEPRVVTPQEAQNLAKAMEPLPAIFGDLAYTISTEPGRTRAAVVKTLRDFRDSFDSFDHEHGNAIVAAIAEERANAIENGADW